MNIPRRRAIPFTLALLALLALPGAAVQAQAAPDPARLTAARRVLDASGSVDVMLTAIRANLPAQRAANPSLPDEFWSRFEARLTQDAPQLVDSIAVVYARNFTERELNDLVAFYHSPTGRRFRELQPTLVTESAGIGQRWGARIGFEIGSSLRPK